ncbi:esterase-like activity of phytase family protein [Methylomonas sp. EFPC3]|uniref:esterase-like activity of phytase family protein n=1 Tax=Methylomonas sp. EFPC3 TaxID=3021710 RepID=UPI002417EF55|nr:esterase-like activity of phytase family protein [Methylomonas sp. EFPC3]WFP52108.1 esterase-like activity of phytase family protein [Methylomonas sp. EFPC3]
MRVTPSLLMAGLLLADTVSAAPTFVNGLAISGATADQFGSSVNDGRVGFFSDIYYDTHRNEWWGLSDRGPGGGSLNYETRVQRFTLDINPVSGAISNFQIAQTLKFNKNGAALNGLAPNPTNALGNAFDPEGIVVNPKNGNLLVSDEYGPSLYEIDRNSGAVVKTYATPANLMPRNAASGVANYAADTGNNSGKRNNRGFEGLAVSPDGKYAFAMLQSAMLDEGASSGSVNRIVKFDTATGEAVAQYAYQMKRSGQGQGVSALVALNDHEFLVLERNNRGVGVGADLATADKEVYKIDLTGASDVSGIDLDAAGAVYTKVAKSSQFLDLDANTLAELGNKSPEKWEGLAIGPKLADGSYLLLAGTDNDYSVTQNAGGTQFDVYFRFSDADPYAGSIQCPLGQTEACVWTANGSAATLSAEYQLLPGVLHAYKVSAADLGNYAAPVPVPAAVWLFGSGALSMLRLTAKRKVAA